MKTRHTMFMTVRSIQMIECLLFLRRIVFSSLKSITNRLSPTSVKICCLTNGAQSTWLKALRSIMRHDTLFKICWTTNWAVRFHIDQKCYDQHLDQSDAWNKNFPFLKKLYKILQFFVDGKLQQTPLFRTTFTRTIKLNLLLKWLLGSNLSQTSLPS